MSNLGPPEQERDDNARFDVVVVGAGFAGLYLVHRLRGLGLSVRVYEAALDVGGTWYWNRYPGARCDAESLAYSFSFSTELEQEWDWTERYASQPEILRYAQHVADRFELRRDIRFGRRVTRATYSEARTEWTVETDRGDRATARYCIMATGCLSVPLEPDFDGLSEFPGDVYWTSKWPEEGVDFAGKRVAVIGTGSSAIQAIPIIAEQALHLTVFQRTANFSIPARNAPLEQDFLDRFKARYREHRELQRSGQSSGFGDTQIEPVPASPRLLTAAGASQDEIRASLEEAWEQGGARFMGAIGDTLVNPETNEVVSEFVREKIREIVRDPDTAEILCPSSHPLGTKRICVDTSYYDTYNRDNVSLVSVEGDPVEETRAGRIRLHGGDSYEVDAIVLATGFDAMTGALLRMEIKGRDSISIQEKWATGPKTYLGLGVSGFPNLFMITGPGSPSVISNMLVSIEQHVDWIADCIEYMGRHGYRSIEASQDAEASWMEHVSDVANGTLFPRAGSWYLGANVPGKPRVFMPYVGGVGAYREKCDQVATEGYEGFELSA